MSDTQQKKKLKFLKDSEGEDSIFPDINYDKLFMKSQHTPLTAKIKPHETHYACQEMMEKYGGKTIGCCCTGHNCADQRKRDMNYLIYRNNMHIRLNVRGTNQYSKKGRLEEVVFCPHCGAFNDEFKPLQEVNGFINPRREKVTHCHRCTNLLTELEK